VDRVKKHEEEKNLEDASVNIHGNINDESVNIQENINDASINIQEESAEDDKK